MEQWIHENLSTILDFPVPDDLTKYILGIENERDLDEYLNTLLDYDNSKHRQFISQLKKKQASSKDLIGYKKSSANKDSSQFKSIQKPSEKKKGKTKVKEAPTETPKPEKIEKKKAKYVNLYSQEGRDRETVLLKGRHRCNCEAKQHALINNCLNCGNIVCSQQGAGPCLFCGDLVCSPEEQKILASNSKQADNLYNKLMDKKPSKGYEDSVKQLDRLLEFDRNSSQRTKVIDDESDYYQSNSVWLSKTEKERLKKREDEIQAQKHRSRLDRKVALDFAGREVIDDDFYVPEETIDDFLEHSEFESCNTCPSIHFDRPTYVKLNLWPQNPNNKPKISDKNRIQDKEYLEMTDEGYCLSMHQPYASLLVAGIKTHEGRTWYSSHRGRLWIASASKVPSTEEISSLEHQYRVLKDEHIKFPENYPTGCLLGCVTVTDVLSQEEYRKMYPDGESDSPYVFICEDCYQLPIKFPMQGKYKIYKLDAKIHRAAMKSLERVMKKSSLVQRGS
ncbi:activating signal cointegrator 1 isoform X2 [Belonocnema kinseyi]|uniref:activating signal cointegrator 1 isoform X2 n=1 Tax=Belonocnema kinseyi TaxID=2817044 RepID=UPI00143D69AA|nr:activating signal cointegrator 1 isoform X2 [Belonocnema kinseyi]